MAKATINGDSFVIRSELTFREIKMIENFHPAHLKVFDSTEPEQAPEIVFLIACSEKASISKYGATFQIDVPNEDRQASITLPLPTDVKQDCLVNWIYEKYGHALHYLSLIERTIREDHIIQKVMAEHEEILASIAVDQEVSI